MPKPEYSEAIKNETPDPKAFERFTEFARKILQVSKEDAEKVDQGDSRSTRAKSELS